MNNQIVVIGGGPAGLEAALAAGRAQVGVILISDGPVGGRSGWRSLLPSKVWLDAAERLDGENQYQESRTAAKKQRPEIDGITRRIQVVKEEWQAVQLRTLAEAGVEIISGKASFLDPWRVKVEKADADEAQIIAGDKFIIATGSVPIFPPALKPDGRLVIAPRFASHLKDLPERMIVIGAGPTGCETAYMFNRLGVYVTWIVDQFGILPGMHVDLGVALGVAIARQGVHIVQGQMVERLERVEGGVTAVLTDGARYQADRAFVAIGRKGDLDGLNLEAAGLKPESDGRFALNRFGQISGSHIYLAGDADKGWMTANKAMAQGRIAGRHATGFIGPGYDERIIPQVVYSEPEVAQVGEMAPGADIENVRLSFDHNLKSHIEGNEHGFIEIALHKGDRRLLGGMAIGSQAAAILAPIALALSMQGTVDDLARIYPAHPTLSELAFSVARKV